MTNIAVIGLGVMGLPMAKNLVARGHDVTGMDLSAEAQNAFGNGQAPSAEALKPAEIIVTMLPEGAHVAKAYDEVVLPGAAEDALLIDCSTIDVDTARSLAASAAARGLAMIDAPVSGGPEAAGKGTLSFMVGGPEEGFSRAGSILADMGAKITYFGEAGAGQAAKACHNMICGITAMAVVEGFALADALGLDLAKFQKLCSGAAAQSWSLDNRCPIPGVVPEAPASNGYAPGFAARLMAKDLRLAQAAAESSGQATPFGAAAAQTFTEFAESGGGEFDFSAIYRTLRSLPASK
ncbi:MAG: 3-hydroxyisobutyrate dehydrogenase [Geminicoccaceae bacterium]